MKKQTVEIVGFGLSGLTYHARFIPVIDEYACFLAKRFAQHFSFSSESYQAIRRERERQMLDKCRRQKHAYSSITGIFNKLKGLKEFGYK